MAREVDPFDRVSTIGEGAGHVPVSGRMIAKPMHDPDPPPGPLDFPPKGAQLAESGRLEPEFDWFLGRGVAGLWRKRRFVHEDPTTIIPVTFPGKTRGTVSPPAIAFGTFSLAAASNLLA